MNVFNSLKLYVLILFGIFFIILISLYINNINIKKTPSKNLQNIIIATSTPTLSNVEIIRGDTSKKQVIFTFDGGATAESGYKILEVLKNTMLKAHFSLRESLWKNTRIWSNKLSLTGMRFLIIHMITCI